MKILVIIPVFNEETSIEDVLKSLFDSGYADNILVINDCSTDNSLNITKNHEQVKTISLSCNLGIGGAVQTGMKFAKQNGYDLIVQFDGDGQHLAKEIKTIIQPVMSGNADLVIGSRFLKIKSQFQSTASRRIGIRILSNILKFLTGKRIYDVTSGFRAFSPKAVSLLANNYPTDYPEPETILMLSKCNMNIIEVPVNMKERQGGESSIKGLIGIYYMIKVIFSILVANIRTYSEKK